MTLTPTSAELRARALADLRIGLPVRIGDMLAVAVEVLSDTRYAAMVAAGGAVALTRRRAETLKARAYDGDIARIIVPTGASLSWVQALADPATDLAHPLKGPLASLRDGDPDPARRAIALAKEARLLPAVLLSPAHGDTHALTVLPQEDPDGGPSQAEVVSARVPLSVASNARLHVFRPTDGGEEHYAIEIGEPDRTAPVLARLHSACFTGDLLGSLKCDCGAQLQAALSAMGAECAGVLLYLNQEGRGIGLANKMRAYALQDQGFDTVEANHRLGFEDDERDFRIGSALLTQLGFQSVRLMTNNPAKDPALMTNEV